MYIYYPIYIYTNIHTYIQLGKYGQRYQPIILSKM